MNPAQSPQTRTANQVHEHSLSLIVQRVPGKDLVQPRNAVVAPAFSRLLREGGDFDFQSLSKQMPKESIPQLARRRLNTDAFVARMARHIVAVDVKLEIMLSRQIR